MSELCSACLCEGRNLFHIADTGFYQTYSEILNEIHIFDLNRLCLRLCWECKALLRRFCRFKSQVQKSCMLLLQYANRLEQPPAASPRLRIDHISTHISDTVIKKEPSDVPELEVKEEEEHWEPETFVNDLPLEKKVEKKVKEPKEKKKKVKPKKTKVKKVKLKKKIEPELNDFSDNSIGCDMLNDGDEVVNDKLSCDKCDVICDGKSKLEKHIQDVHAVRPKPVVQAKTKDALPERPQCVECGKTFSSKKTYRYHLNVLHKGQNRYPCPRCGKVYQWKSNLGRHLRSHKAREAGELRCSPCDKRFASVATYRQHLRGSRRHVSENEFSFMCNECGKKFVSKTRLRDHIDWDHLKKIKFKCQLCNKAFKCHTSRYVHVQNVHRNKDSKDNLCHVCGKSYQNAAKLKYHIIAMHTGETPYQCSACGAAFGWYSSLYRHTREVHFKMKLQPKKAKKTKKLGEVLPPLLPPPPLGLPLHQP